MIEFVLQERFRMLLHHSASENMLNKFYSIYAFSLFRIYGETNLTNLHIYFPGRPFHRTHSVSLHLYFILVYICCQFCLITCPILNKYSKCNNTVKMELNCTPPLY